MTDKQMTQGEVLAVLDEQIDAYFDGPRREKPGGDIKKGYCQALRDAVFFRVRADSIDAPSSGEGE